MLKLFILRHGHAEEPARNSDTKDFDRKLTEEGIEKITRVGSFFNNLDEKIDLILISPYVRAKETAEVFLNCLEIKPPTETVDFLACGSSSVEIARGLSKYINNESILLIGHCPDLEVLLCKLISAESVTLKKGSMAKIRLNNGIELSGSLEWLITPKLVKKIKSKKS